MSAAGIVHMSYAEAPLRAEKKKDKKKTKNEARRRRRRMLARNKVDYVKLVFEALESRRPEILKLREKKDEIDGALYAGQVQAVESILEFVAQTDEDEENGGLVEMSPGAGKTPVIILSALYAMAKGLKVLIVTPAGSAWKNLCEYLGIELNHYRNDKFRKRAEFISNLLGITVDDWVGFCSETVLQLTRSANLGSAKSARLQVTNIKHMHNLYKTYNKTGKADDIEDFEAVVDLVLCDEYHRLDWRIRSCPLEIDSLKNMCKSSKHGYIGFSGTVKCPEDMTVIFKGEGRPQREIVAHVIRMFGYDEKGDKFEITTKADYVRCTSNSPAELQAFCMPPILKDFIFYMEHCRFKDAKMLIFRDGRDDQHVFASQILDLARFEKLVHPFTKQPFRILPFDQKLLEHAPGTPECAYDILICDRACRMALDVPAFVFGVDLSVGMQPITAGQTTGRLKRFLIDKANYPEFSEMAQFAHFYVPTPYKKVMERIGIEWHEQGAQHFHEHVLPERLKASAEKRKDSEEKKANQVPEEEEPVEMVGLVDDDDEDEKEEHPVIVQQLEVLAPRKTKQEAERKMKEMFHRPERGVSEAVASRQKRPRDKEPEQKLDKDGAEAFLEAAKAKKMHKKNDDGGHPEKKAEAKQMDEDDAAYEPDESSESDDEEDEDEEDNDDNYSQSEQDDEDDDEDSDCESEDDEFFDEEDEETYAARKKRQSLKKPGALQKRHLQEIYDNPPICEGCGNSLCPMSQITKFLDETRISDRTRALHYSDCQLVWTGKLDKGRLIGCTKCIENKKQLAAKDFKELCSECKNPMILSEQTKDKTSSAQILDKPYYRKLAGYTLATLTPIYDDQKEVVMYSTPTTCRNCEKHRPHVSYPTTEYMDELKATSDDIISSIKAVQAAQGHAINSVLEGRAPDMAELKADLTKAKSRIVIDISEDDVAATYVDPLEHDRKIMVKAIQKELGKTTEKKVEMDDDEERVSASKFITAALLESKLEEVLRTRESISSTEFRQKVLTEFYPNLQDMPLGANYKDHDHMLRSRMNTIKDHGSFAVNNDNPDNMVFYRKEEDGVMY